MDFDIRRFLPEIPLGFEAPVEKASDPVLQAFDINGDEGIQVFPERRNELPAFFEPFDEGLALFGDVVHGFLDSHPVKFHEDNDHVPSLSAGLFNIVRCDILPIWIPSTTELIQRERTSHSTKRQCHWRSPAACERLGLRRPRRGDRARWRIQ